MKVKLKMIRCDKYISCRLSDGRICYFSDKHKRNSGCIEDVFNKYGIPNCTPIPERNYHIIYLKVE